MKTDKLRALTNHHLDVRVVSLRSWRFAKEIQPRDSGGPYVIAQEGYAPEDLSMRLGEFVLGRSGQWLSVEMMLRMAVDIRRAEFVFGTSAEVMKLLASLPTKVSMFAGDISSSPSEKNDADEFGSAFSSAERELPSAS